jgi:hypothetical protein
MDKLVIVLFGMITLIGGIFVMGLIFSLPTYFLWNGCLVGAIDGVKSIGWLQAFGLNILAGILFKSTVKQS